MKNQLPETITENTRNIKITREADVIVVGGGPAGTAAAISAARSGAKTVLIERYGHCGGLATGGLVALIMPMSDGTAIQTIKGICQELVERMDTHGETLHPKMEEIGSRDPEIVKKWKSYPFFVVDNAVRYSVLFNPEILKCVINDMIQEAGVTPYYHSWVSQAIVEDHQVKGIIFESKSGRQAILGKVVIDTTGDGDVFSFSDAAFDATTDPSIRSSTQALVFRLGNVDGARFAEFKQEKSQKWKEVQAKLRDIEMFPMTPFPSWRDDIVWVNNWIPGYNSLDVTDLTDIEFRMRKAMLRARDILMSDVPGFEDCFILDTASQLGIRVGRRLIGEHILTKEDILSGHAFHDTIAVCPPFHTNVSSKTPHMYIPYRSLLPIQIDGLLTAGRCFSADPVANDILAPIQFCVAMGQAAGTAAAIASRDNINPRDINIASLQKALAEQNVYLP